MNQVSLKAYGKVNLSLDVLGKREDGYHEVRMIMQTVNLYDQLLMKKLKSGKIMLEINLPYLPTGEHNLVYRAIDLLRQEYDIQEGVHVTLQKHIPVSAGMAGGSADAAAALVGMNQLFQLRLTKKQLMKYGVKLGADIPYCILRGTALSEGIGEQLTLLPPPPPCSLLVAKPKASASTRLIYEHFDMCNNVIHPNIDAMIDALHKKDLQALANAMGNVLEPVTAQKYPIIGEIKQAMLAGGAINAMMTGSGPTVFGLFHSFRAAEQVRRQLYQNLQLRQTYVTSWFSPQTRAFDKHLIKRRNTT